MENEETHLRANVGKAHKAARKLLKKAGIKDMPTNLREVVRYLKTQQDLQVIRHPFGENISGMLVQIDDQSTIGFNGDMALGRQRFTIAHEIGHLVLGHTCTGQNGHSSAEIEANKFAAELLVPLAFFRADFKRQRDVAALAKKYRVSADMLWFRVSESRVL